MTNNAPVVLHEDETTGDRFLVYSTDKALRLDIPYEIGQTSNQPSSSSASERLRS